MKLNFKKFGGLIPAIIQNASTNQVLMLGFMNEDAYKLTLKTGVVTFWSRTKKRLWQKGESSENYLKTVKIVSDCDNDTLLISVIPTGPTCHTGRYSCFGDKDRNVTFFNELFELIKNRKASDLKKSYTKSLFDKGTNEIIKKIGEESVEVIIAAKSETKKRLVEESCDLLYHLFVLLASKSIEIDDVIKELLKRNK